MKINNAIFSKLLLVLMVITSIPAILNIEFIDTDKELEDIRKPLKFPNYVPNPYPDEISFIPNKKVTSKGTYYYYTKITTSENSYSTITHDDEKKEDSLLIRKRNGKFYWDSNGAKELMTITGFFAPMKENNKEIKKGKYTIFTALDGSGTIIIAHDRISAGGCGYGSKQWDYAHYKEIKVDKGTILYGGGYNKFFPKKPDKWCYGSPKIPVRSCFPNISNIFKPSITGNIIAAVSLLAQAITALLLIEIIAFIFQNKTNKSPRRLLDIFFTKAFLRILAIALLTFAITPLLPVEKMRIVMAIITALFTYSLLLFFYLKFKGQRTLKAALYCFIYEPAKIIATSLMILIGLVILSIIDQPKSEYYYYLIAIFSIPVILTFMSFVAFKKQDASLRKSATKSVFKLSLIMTYLIIVNPYYSTIYKKHRIVEQFRSEYSNQW